MILQKKRTVAVVLISAVMAVLRAVLVYYTMEKNSYVNDTYYLPDNLFVRIFNALTIASVVLFVGFAISLIFEKKRNIVHDLSSSLAGMLVLAFSLFFVVAVFLKRNFVETKIVETEGPSAISVVCVALALVCGIIFLVLGLKSEKSIPSNTSLSLLMIVPTAFTGIRLVRAFVESNAAPSASSGDFRILGLATLLVFFLYDGKSYISPRSSVMFNTFASLSLLFLLVYSIPNIALNCFGTFAFGESAAYSVVDIGISVYVCSRMFGAKLKTDVEE